MKIATCNFSGLCSEHKHKEVAEILSRLNIHIVAGRSHGKGSGRILL